jgi:hypothetical protein
MHTALALAGIALALTLTWLAARLATRLGPSWLRPAHGPLFPLAGLLVAAALLVATATGHAPLPRLATWLGTAERGPLASLTLVTLGLASAVVLLLPLRLLFGLLRPRAAHRAPVPRLALLFGVAPDGSTLDSARSALRWALGLTTLAVFIALAFPTVDPTAGSAVLIALAMALVALQRPDDAAARAVSVPFTPTRPVAPSEDDLLAALGHPPLVSTEAAVSRPRDAWPLEAALLARLDDALLLALSAPPGGGKRSAALRAAAHVAARGRTTLWLGPPPPIVPPDLHLAQAPATLGAGAPRRNHPTDLEVPSRLGLIVVAAADHLSSDAIATLRYTLHRVSQRATDLPPTLLVLGESPSVAAIARAIGAREPELIKARTPLPTRAIARYLLASPPPAATLSAHSGVALIDLDRPRPAARYPEPPTAPDAPQAARAIELLVPRGGPLGRLLRPDAPRTLPLPAPRLLVAMSGDRDAPESRDALARRHLRLALSEARQTRARLAEVFTPRLVEAELAALAEAGLLVDEPAWRATRRRIEAVPTVAARLPLEANDPPAMVRLREPRSGRELYVPAATAEFHHYDGALVSLGDAARFEVRTEPGERFSQGVLIPTEATSSTPIRRLTTRLLDAPRLTRLRFRGPRELELCDARIALTAHHRGVRFFQRQDRDEARAQTRLSPHTEVATLHTEARLILFPADLAPPALHALTHALREVLPLFYANGPEEVGVTWAGPDELAPLADLATAPPARPGRSALVLWDRHPEGLGAVRDLSDSELEPLLLQVHALLSTCACTSHCAACCETSSCTSDELSGSSRAELHTADGADSRLDRHAAARALEPFLAPANLARRPVVVPLATPAAPFRRTA